MILVANASSVTSWTTGGSDCAKLYNAAPVLDEDFARLQIFRAGVGGGPGPLKIVAAEVAGDVDNLADEKEAGDIVGLHGFAGKTGGVDAAGGDFGFLVALGARGRYGPGVNCFLERSKTKICVIRWLVNFEPASGEAVGKNLVERGMHNREIAMRRFAKFRGDIPAGCEIEGNKLAFTPIG